MACPESVDPVPVLFRNTGRNIVADPFYCTALCGYKEISEKGGMQEIWPCTHCIYHIVSGFWNSGSGMESGTADPVFGIPGASSDVW